MTPVPKAGKAWWTGKAGWTGLGPVPKAGKAGWTGRLGRVDGPGGYPASGLVMITTHSHCVYTAVSMYIGEGTLSFCLALALARVYESQDDHEACSPV